MSLSYLRDAIIKTLQARADAATNRAINMRVRPASHDIPAMSADEYALYQTDVLSEARTYAEALRLVGAEYAKLIEPEKVVDITTQPKKGPVYG